MKKWMFTCIMLLLYVPTLVKAQDSYVEKVNRYIEKHKALAIAEQKRSGIPASITLAQGVFETAAGCSELMTQANNHFGIKCKKEWRGETFAHTDDAPNECFRKYTCAYDSYKDHSDYLKTGTRYAALFQLPVTDYNGWAHGLKRCGYATNPKYAAQLIKLIEDFHLQDYTYIAMKDGGTSQAVGVSVIPQQTTYSAKISDTPETTKPAISQVPAEVVPDNDKGVAAAPAATDANSTLTVNGLRAFYAHKGDVLLEQAIKYNVRYVRLLELNDLPDAPLEADMFIYLEKKNSKGAHKHHIVQQGETLLQIAQSEGMQLKQLKTFNMLEDGEMPAAGTMLALQYQMTQKPDLATNTAVANTTSQMKVSYQSSEPAYVYKKTTPANTNDAVPAKAVTTEPAKQEVVTTPSQPAQAPVAQPIQTPPAQEQPVPVPQPVQATPAQQPQPVTQSTPQPQNTTPADSFNIANEKAAEEEDEDAKKPVAAAPKAEEPVDELDRLKAKLDKVVYSPEAPKTTPATTSAKPAETKAAATNTTKPQAAAASDDASRFYTVQKGDTAFAIAKKNSITMKQLMDWNHLNFEDIKIGQKLRVKP